MTYLINSGPVEIKGSDLEDSPVAQDYSMKERTVWCSVVKTVNILAVLQVVVQLRASATGLQVAELTPHLMRRKLAVLARVISDKEIVLLLTLLVTDWTKTAIMLSKGINIARYTASPDVLWPMPIHSCSVNMSQWYKETGPNKQKLKRH